MKIKAIWCLVLVAIIGFFGWKAVEQAIVLIRLDLPFSELGHQWERLTIIAVCGVTCAVFVWLLIRRVCRIIADIRINRENH